MRYAILVALLAFSGCAGVMNARTKEAVTSKSIIERDSFKKTEWLKAPTMKANLLIESRKRDRSEWQIDQYHLREMRDESTETGFIQIYCSHEEIDWLFFDHAVDSDGHQMEFHQISRTTSQYTKYGVGIIEDFAIDVTRDYLAAKASTGLRIRVYGKNGDRTLDIPAFYIQGFLERHDAFTMKPSKG